MLFYGTHVRRALITPQAVFETSYKKHGKNSQQSYRDSEFYMSHYQKDALTEKG
jgi:ATP-dependent RNA helicase DDX54/DBP10